MSLNPGFLTAGYGKRFTYTGAKELNSGLPGEKAKPMTVKQQTDAAVKAAKGLAASQLPR